MGRPVVPVERNDIDHRYWLAAMAIMAALAGTAFLTLNGSGGDGDDIVVQRPAPTATPTTPAAPSQAPHAPPSARNEVPLSGTGTIDPHSRDYWAQSNLTLHVHRELRTLTATVRVARTERVEPTGAWLTLPRSCRRASDGHQRRMVWDRRRPWSTDAPPVAVLGRLGRGFTLGRSDQIGRR